MPTPKKQTVPLPLRVAPELRAWLESQVPAKGGSAQQVAISLLEELMVPSAAGIQQRVEIAEAIILGLVEENSEKRKPSPEFMELVAKLKVLREPQPAKPNKGSGSRSE